MCILPDIPAELPVLIAGPTASGKSALALEIAQRHGGCIVNADALQVFANWRVLTARPSAEEEARAPHLLYGHVPREGDYSVGHWLRDVAPLLAGARPIIVGGTGLYFRALTEGLADIPAITDETRALANDRLASEGLAAMVDDLARKDAATLARLDRQNPMRVQRAWEVLHQTGRPLSQWQAETASPLLPLSACTPIVLTPKKQWLNARIARRFEMMMDQGALEEARANLTGWDPALLSSKAIGGPELIAHLGGQLTLDEAIERAVISSRQYAKRQRTWFRARMKDWIALDPS
ncbi:MAG: tRNA (adenosine(37)-N6)-dimethylallyltransferase MiaA [Brevirhabdus sp.]